MSIHCPEGAGLKSPAFPKSRFSSAYDSLFPADDREPPLRATLWKRIRKLSRKGRIHFTPHQLHRFDVPADRENIVHLLSRHPSFGRLFCESEQEEMPARLNYVR